MTCRKLNVIDHYRGATLRQFKRDPAADPTAGAGHDGDAILKLLHERFLSCETCDAKILPEASVFNDLA